MDNLFRSSLQLTYASYFQRDFIFISVWFGAREPSLFTNNFLVIKSNMSTGISRVYEGLFDTRVIYISDYESANDLALLKGSCLAIEPSTLRPLSPSPRNVA
jgi:hypothetical protein